ncbi:phage tail-collar fiber domain-containing protein [Leclercia tamurae]|uniref:phage tail-collar fiber domain-containing protein n=1 Tax=Leclercia tamurae TaxID=2926467 RepID=UPI0036F473D5
MTVKYKTVITKAGAEKLAAATVPNGAKVNFTAMAIGDGGGKLPTPDASQTKLVNEVWRYALNKISQDNKNKNYVVAELLIPPERGGFWMREMGLYDDTGTLIAVGNMAESYKPELAEGSGRAQTVRMVIMVSDIESVELAIDTTLVMATQDYVDDKLAEHEKSRRHPDATLTEKGFTQLSSATDSTSESVAATPKAVKAAYDLADGKYTAQDATTARKGITQLSSSTASTSETLAATPKAVKTVMDATKLKAPIESPALTGTPTAPTAEQTSNDTQLATTAFVTRAVAPAFMMRGALPAVANLNSYGPVPDFIGQWSQNSATGAQIANGFPEDNAVGVLDVIPGGAFGGTQKYTVSRTGNVYLRTLTGSWNGTDGPWGAWQPVGFCSMPGYFTGDMNTLLTPGIWSITSAVTNGPVPDGQTATPTGICTIELRSSTNSVVQTFKSVVTNAAFINRTWTRTLSGTTWSNWDPQGKGALADVGIGSAITMVSAMDWQTFNFIPGAQHVCLPSNQTNIPEGIAYAGTSSPTNINVLGGRANTTALVMLVTQFTQSAAAKSYIVVMSGVAGSRTFAIYENFTSASIVQLANGGTGGKTLDEARGNLGINRLVQGKDDTYITSQSDNYRLFVNDHGGWGVLNNIGTPQALALDKGGTGATDAAKARVNLELGNSATRNVGTAANTVAAGNDSRIVNAVQKAEFTSGPGWVKFPDGTIIQTGVSAAGYLGSPSDVNYPIPFTAGVDSIVASFDNAVAGANDCPAFACTPLGTGGFRLMSSRGNTGTIPFARWIAKGK